MSGAGKMETWSTRRHIASYFNVSSAKNASQSDSQWARRRSYIARDVQMLPPPAVLALFFGRFSRNKSSDGLKLTRCLLRLLISARIFFNHYLRRRQSRDRYPEGRSADII